MIKLRLFWIAGTIAPKGEANQMNVGVMDILMVK